MISPELSISEKPGHLKSCLTGCRVWIRDLVQLSQTAWGKDEVRKRLCRAGPVARQVLSPHVFNVSTDDNRTPDWKHDSGSSSLHWRFAVFTLVVTIPWDPDPCFPCSKWWKFCWLQRERTRPSTDSFPPGCRNKAADFEMQPSYLVSIFLSRFLGRPLKTAALVDRQEEG